ncbi:hypothetical protein BB561_001307 [Smittium simulii]|uniref:Uncharacterized protein n=1 Tax=Smittium simulii TaxID=133385 RepID=A0A2T9YV74_9FUNG|nr:hypothetical protein BB561_001307 [Smittium simulii]
MGDSLEEDFLIEEEYRVVSADKKRKPELNNNKKKSNNGPIVIKKAKKTNVFTRPNTAEKQSEFFNQALKAAYKGISSLELVEFSCTDKHFYTKILENKDINSLVDVVKEGIRASNVAREIRENSEARIAKLFAKHIKIEEQVRFLKAFDYDVGVGTPARIRKLAEIGAIDFSKVELILLDCHQDTKTMTIMSLDDTRLVISELWKNTLLPLAQNNKLKLLLF